MSSGMMLDDIIMNIFTKIPKITTKANQENYFSRTKDGVIQLYKGSMQDFTWKTTINDTNRTLRSHHYISIDSWRKYLNGITVIDSTQAELDKMVDEFISNKTKFQTKQIIKSDIQQIMNMPEKARFISSMTPTGFKNDQEKSRCYVNSTFQVLFFNVFFRSLIMNIDCDMMLRNLDKSSDDYNSHVTKIMILQVIQKMFCEMLIGGRKVVNSDNIFFLTNIRTNVQQDSSEFEELIQEMISSEIFSNQEICHIDLNGKKK